MRTRPTAPEIKSQICVAVICKYFAQVHFLYLYQLITAMQSSCQAERWREEDGRLNYQAGTGRGVLIEATGQCSSRQRSIYNWERKFVQVCTSMMFRDIVSHCLRIKNTKTTVGAALDLWLHMLLSWRLWL